MDDPAGGKDGLGRGGDGGAGKHHPSSVGGDGGRRRSFSRRGEIAACQVAGGDGSRTGGRISTLPQSLSGLPYLPGGERPAAAAAAIPVWYCRCGGAALSDLPLPPASWR